MRIVQVLSRFTWYPHTLLATTCKNTTAKVMEWVNRQIVVTSDYYLGTWKQRDSMHYSSDIETLMDDGIVLMIVFLRNMWNTLICGISKSLDVRGEGGTFHFKISAQRSLHFKSSVISATMRSFKFPRYRIKGNYSRQPIRTQQSYSYIL